MHNAFFPLSEKEAKESGISNRFSINEQAEFPRRLRELREKSGQTLAVASEGIGVTRSTLGLYEKGENVPDVKVIVRIARHYGATVNYLLGEDERPEYESELIYRDIGLADGSVLALRKYNSLYRSDDQNKHHGKRALDMVNILLQSEELEEIVLNYEQLCICIYTLAYLEENDTDTDNEKLRILMHEIIEYGVYPVQPSDAFDFYIHQLRISIAEAINIGIQKRLDNIVSEKDVL